MQVVVADPNVEIHPDRSPDSERVQSRADLLPEEQSVGSDDPQLQAEVILEDSDRRTADPEDAAVNSKQTPTTD